MIRVSTWALGIVCLFLIASCSKQTSEPTEQASEVQELGEVHSTSAEEPPAQTRIIDLSPDAFEKNISELSDVVLIDARTPAEFATGHIPGALNINVKSSDFKEQIQGLDPNRTYMVNCLSGKRSTRACNIMKDEGFTSLYNLEGGVRAWEKAGKELVKP